ncbi:hypothetical protein SAMN06265219_11135 [Gracilimonas mengyeensis]|uniref:Uncharacterized protein n=1 Tax=Gracilimonas mengyeensis TaxID=1302730 RepID=A0A521E9J8_9BACT|nr:hypothetical protein SAMN06265219_11135 [Gracilimonas mengyeensis]
MVSFIPLSPSIPKPYRIYYVYDLKRMRFPDFILFDKNHVMSMSGHLSLQERKYVHSFKAFDLINSPGTFFISNFNHAMEFPRSGGD